VFIEAKDDGGGGDNWTTGAAISVQIISQIITTNKPTSSFLQAGCPSCRPTNSVKALKGNKFDYYYYYIMALFYLTWGESAL